MDPQTEEMILRLRLLLPKVAADTRFTLCFACSQEGPIPVIYLSAEDTNDLALPNKYIMLLKKAENQFAIRLEGFYDVTHFMMAVKWWPRNVSSEEADRLIIEIFEGWFRLQESIAKQIAVMSGPSISSLPL